MGHSPQKQNVSSLLVFILCLNFFWLTYNNLQTRKTPRMLARDEHNIACTGERQESQLMPNNR